MSSSTGNTVEHPAKFSPQVLEELGVHLVPRVAPYKGAVIVDPFAGVGGVHRWSECDGEGTPAYTTYGVELEPEWAATHERTFCGDSRELGAVLAREVGDAVIPDAIVTSPAYGNRMADSYAGDARGTKRFTYRIALDRPLTSGNGAGMQWGDSYRELHAAVWAECVDILRPGGWMFVNVSNHIRAGVLQPVVEWHLEALTGLGLYVDAVVPVATRRMRFGANSELRAATEKILVLQKGLT